MTRYKAFCKIVETGSFTRAAEELGYTQAAVSQMIQSIEEELGLTLFYRRRSGVRLTKEGEKIYPVILKYVQTARELESTASEINGLESGEIHIGICSSVSQRILPPLISSFGEIYPNIHFVLKQGDNTTMPDWIRSGLIDFGFVYPEAAHDLYCEILFKDKYVAVVPSDSPLAQKESISLSELSRYPFILCEEGNTNTVEIAYKKNNLSIFPMYRISDDHTILAMVESGIGVSIISSLLLYHSNYNIKTLDIEEEVIRTVGVTCRDPKLLPIASKKFVDYMFKNVSKIEKINDKNIIFEEK